jgi:hypothetical protein
VEKTGFATVRYVVNGEIFLKKIPIFDKIDDKLGFIGTAHETPFSALAGRVGGTVNEVGGILGIGDNPDIEI